MMEPEVGGGSLGTLTLQPNWTKAWVPGGPNTFNWHLKWDGLVGLNP